MSSSSSSDGDAAILPRIVPLGDHRRRRDRFRRSGDRPTRRSCAGVCPTAIKPLERRLLLAELILKWANSPAVRSAEGSPLIANTPPAALGLADDLARLMDDMTTRQVDWNRLDSLVPDDLDRYWQMSLRFPQDRARSLAGHFAPSAAPSKRPSAATS